MNDTHPKKKLISFVGDEDDEEMSIVDEIAEFVGSDVAVRFQREFAGRRISLPRAEYLLPDNAVAKALGFKTTHKICSEVVPVSLGGRHIVVPMGEFDPRKLLRKRAATLLNEGNLSVRQIALALKCHERTIWRVKAKLKNGTTATGQTTKTPQSTARRAQLSEDRRKAEEIVRTLLLEGHSAALLRDLLTVPGDIILSIKTELIREGKL